MRRWVALMVGILLVPAALAQTDRGTITGTVTDSTDAVVANARVLLTNSETGAHAFSTQSWADSARNLI
jgi:hypothetical protein